MLFLNRNTVMSFAKTSWKAVDEKAKSGGREKEERMEAGSMCRVQDEVTSRFMIEASWRREPSSKAERKARVVVSMRSLRLLI